MVKISDLEAFAQLAEYGASLIPPSFAAVVPFVPHDRRAETLINDLYSILVPNRPPLVIGGALEERATNLRQTGYAWIFQDPSRTVGGDQANHFWYYVSQGFIGKAVGSIGNYLHETVIATDGQGRSYQDYALGNEGLQLGAELFAGQVQIRDVGNYIRNNLGPNSTRINYWLGDPGSSGRLKFYALSLSLGNLFVPIAAGEQGR